VCGIVFIYNPRKESSVLKNFASNGLKQLIHRGPDECEIKVSGKAVLGHRRLSIIDLEESHQPMSDETGRYSLIFNGEIYNFKSLREQLAGGWTFRTQGDTEVLLAGVVQEGYSFLSKCEGMFAFAMWDSHEGQLMLGRDRMGKKPLYYQQLPGGGIICASEIPALRQLTNISWREDENSTADYFRYGYSLPGHTAIKEVKEILPGNVATWSQNKGFETRSWWRIDIENIELSEQKVCSSLREGLIKAVEHRMVADVEVGAFLSGGVDSSLICAIVRKELERPLKTFTIGFEDESFDERKYAEQVSRRINSQHFEEVLSSWNETELESLILNHVGQPFADASLLPTALVSRVAAKQVKVALSGDGGDELFSGYQRYQARNILMWYSRLPKKLRRFAEKSIRFLPEPTAHHSRSVLKKAHLFLDIVNRQKAETPYFAPVMIEPEVMQRLIPHFNGKGHEPPGLTPISELDDIKRMMYADALIYLPQDILTKVDRASMASSLETRAPFLDSNVVKLAFSLPIRRHRNSISGKKLLKQAFSDLLPNNVWGRRKQGFGVPTSLWFKGQLGSRLLELVQEDSDQVVSLSETQNILKAHQSGYRDYSYRLWAIYSYVLWKSSCFKGWSL